MLSIDTILGNRPAPTKAQLNAGLTLLLSVSEAIREAGSIPSGTLYAILCGKVTLDGYNSLISTLKNAGLIEEKNHLLTWIGPKVANA